VRGLIVAIVFVGCASGGESSPEVDAASEAANNSCVFACEAPPSTCKSACAETVTEAVGCDAGSGVFVGKTLDCPFGCDPASGRCRSPAAGCARIECGKTTACGATCSTTSGCCTSTSYDKSTGLAISGSRACCDDGDEMTGTTDCGTGVNHGVNREGNCAVSWEGAMNGGTPCATAHCRKRVCPG
jgi:hypothetical protein